MHLHFDCFSGISGDMILGALLDAGLSTRAFRSGLKALPVQNFHLKIAKVYRGPIHATKASVMIRPSGTQPLSWTHIQRTLKRSTLSPWVKTQALSVFGRLAEVEGKVHGKSPATIHFHEVGVIDSVVDVVGSLLGCHLLGVTSCSASPVNVGAGTVSTAHGLLPVPAPAVAELATGVPITSKGPQIELTTPTGLAILTSLTHQYELVSPVVSQTVGYGAGTADPDGWANVLRVFLGKTPPSLSYDTDQVVQLETNIDDLNPQLYESLMEQLFQAGALDVSLTPSIMKKGRPGIILSVLASSRHTDRLTQTLFLETTTIGIRTQTINRITLPRTMGTIKVAHGTVRVKSTTVGNKKKSSPEFQDCLALAKKSGRPVREVLEEAIRNME